MNRRRVVTFAGPGPFQAARYSSAYSEPLLAGIMAPVHLLDGARSPVWVEADILKHDGLRFTIADDTAREIAPAILPPLSPSQRIAFAILCARSVHDAPAFLEWSGSWLTGRDRSYESAIKAFGTEKLPACDRAYVAHWAVMSAAFPHDALLPAQTAALVAANLFPSGTFDFVARAEAAMDLGL